MNYPIAGTCTCPQASLLFIRELISNSAKFEYSGHKGTHWHKITGRLCPHDVHSQNIHSQSVNARNDSDIVSPKLPYSVTVAICYNCLALMCGVRQLGNIPASPCCHGSINQHSLTHIPQAPEQLCILVLWRCSASIRYCNTSFSVQWQKYDWGGWRERRERLWSSRLSVRSVCVRRSRTGGAKAQFLTFKG